MKKSIKEEYDNGKIVWRNEEGQLHRDDGPTIIYPKGTKEYYQNGQLHREDGPAVIEANETKYWYKNDQLHREDGPAIIYADGTKEYYLNGEEVDKEEVMGNKNELSNFSDEELLEELKRRMS